MSYSNFIQHAIAYHKAHYIYKYISDRFGYICASSELHFPVENPTKTHSAETLLRPRVSSLLQLPVPGHQSADKFLRLPPLIR